MIADKLKQALDEGRLDLAEYDDRLQKAYAAKTYGDLKGLLDDLPNTTLAAKISATDPVPHGATAVPPVKSERAGQLVKAWLGGFGGIFVVSTVIWLVTSIASGHAQYFWPVWLLIPMAFGAMGRFGGGYHRRRDR